MNKTQIAAAVLGAMLIPAAAHAQAAGQTQTQAQARTQAQAPAGAPAAAPATPAAGAAVNVAVGAKVFDSQGAQVGTVESVQNDMAVVNTGTARATLATSAFAAKADGLSINATRAQLEAAVADAAAKAGATLDAALVADAQVKSQDGAVVGTIKEVTGEQVILARPEGAVALTRQFFTADASGLTLRMTAAQLDAAAKAAQPSGG